MTRDKINLQYLKYDDTDSIGITTIEKQAITASNGIELQKAFACKDNSLAIVIENTGSSDGTLTILAGDMQNMHLGNSNITVPQNSTSTIRMRDVARYEHKDGSVYFDFSESFTGNIYAIAEKAGLGS